MQSRDRGAPKSHGHGEAHSTEILPAARKKHDERWFPAKSSHKDWFAGHARKCGARTRFAAMAQALVRRRGLDENDRRRREKQSEEAGTNGGGSDPITRLRSKEKPRHGLHHANTTLKMATTAPRSKQKVARRCSLSGEHCSMYLHN